MTAAQKIAKEKFKKAIAIRKKTGVSLKEAFSEVYGKKKVGAVKKKKAAPKKVTKKVVKKAAPKKAAKKHSNWGIIPAHKRRVNGVISGYGNKYIFNVYDRDNYGDIISKSSKKVTISASSQQNAKDKLYKRYPNSKYFSELYSSESITKKVGKITKKIATKKSSNYHKDTKSHNVRISVISGVNRELLQDLMKVQKSKEHYIKLSDKLNLEYQYLKKQKGTLVNSQKIANRKYYKQVNNILKELLVHQNQIKKNLK